VNRPWIRTICSGIAFLPIVGGCHRDAPTTGGAVANAPSITVVKPAKKAINRVIEQPGAVTPYEETRLFAKLACFVRSIGVDANTKRPIDIGGTVKAGQILAELAIPETEEEAKQKAALVKQAEAEVNQARKGMAASAAGVASAQAMVNEAKAGLSRGQALYDRWKSESERISGLVKSGVIDSQTRDETTNQFKAAEATRNEAAAKVASAEAEVRKAEADHGKAAADVAAAEAKLEVSKTEVARLAALMGYTRIAAPYDGVVTRRDINTGDFLSGAGKQAAFTVARLHPVRVVVHVPEADAGLVAEGLAARMTVQALPGRVLEGKVARTSWSLDPGARTLRTEIDLPNEKGVVRPGMYVYARITAPLPEAWAVPAAAVGKMGDDSIVYFVVEGKAVRTPVQALRGDGVYTQVSRYQRSGAEPWIEFGGSEILAMPAAALTDGQEIPAAGPQVK
jgi:HlyD family secretion protein